jgi:uncharacterized protein (TIGR02265 family)
VPGITLDLPENARELDLPWRVGQIPHGAMSRGIFFNQIEQELKRRGLTSTPLWGSRAAAQARKNHTLYPVQDLLVTYATAGALIDRDPSEGIRQIWIGAVQHFTSTWFGRAFQRFLRPDPVAAFHWIERSREYICNYGHWRVELRGPEHVVIHMFDEYLWIDSAHRGGCEGLLIACGLAGEVRAELDTPFQGRLDVRWQLGN